MWSDSDSGSEYESDNEGPSPKRARYSQDDHAIRLLDAIRGPFAPIRVAAGGREGQFAYRVRYVFSEGAPLFKQLAGLKTGAIAAQVGTVLSADLECAGLAILGRLATELGASDLGEELDCLVANKTAIRREIGRSVCPSGTAEDQIKAGKKKLQPLVGAALPGFCVDGGTVGYINALYGPLIATDAGAAAVKAIVSASLLILMADFYGDDLGEAAIGAIQAGTPFLAMPYILEAAVARRPALAPRVAALFGECGSRQRTEFEAQWSKVSEFHVGRDGKALPPAADGTVLGFGAYLLPDHTTKVVLGPRATVEPPGFARWDRFWACQEATDTLWPLVRQFHTIYTSCGPASGHGALRIYASLEEGGSVAETWKRKHAREEAVVAKAVERSALAHFVFRCEAAVIMRAAAALEANGYSIVVVKGDELVVTGENEDVDRVAGLLSEWAPFKFDVTAHGSDLVVSDRAIVGPDEDLKVLKAEIAAGINAVMVGTEPRFARVIKGGKVVGFYEQDPKRPQVYTDRFADGAEVTPAMFLDAIMRAFAPPLVKQAWFGEFEGEQHALNVTLSVKKAYHDAIRRDDFPVAPCVAGFATDVVVLEDAIFDVGGFVAFVASLRAHADPKAAAAANIEDYVYMNDEPRRLLGPDGAPIKISAANVIGDVWWSTDFLTFELDRLSRDSPLAAACFIPVFDLTAADSAPLVDHDIKRAVVAPAVKRQMEQLAAYFGYLMRPELDPDCMVYRLVALFHGVPRAGKSVLTSFLKAWHGRPTALNLDDLDNRHWTHGMVNRNDGSVKPFVVISDAGDNNDGKITSFINKHLDIITGTGDIVINPKFLKPTEFGTTGREKVDFACASNDGPNAIKMKEGGAPAHHILRRLAPVEWLTVPPRDDPRLLARATNRATAADRGAKWSGSLHDYLCCLYWYAITDPSTYDDTSDVFAGWRTELAAAVPLGDYDELVQMLPPVGPLPIAYHHHFGDKAPHTITEDGLEPCVLDGAGRATATSADAAFYDAGGEVLAPGVTDPKYPPHTHFYEVGSLFRRIHKKDAKITDARRVLGPHLPEGASIEVSNKVCGAYDKATGECHLFNNEFGARCCARPRMAKLSVVCLHAPIMPSQ